MKKIKEAFAILIAATIVFCATYFPAWLLMPVRTAYGATWDLYLQEEPDTIDVLYLGSSIAYCDVIPAIVWEETGLTSYVMAGPEQTFPITYYYLREACKTQSPQAVVLELNGMFFPQYENYTKVNLSYMPWSINRILATLYGAEPEEKLGSFFPIYNYHDRVYSVTSEEIEQRLSPEADPYAGYTLLLTASEQMEYTDRDYLTNTDAYRENLGYLQKIAAFCAGKDIELVLYFAPVHCYVSEDALRTLEQAVDSIPHSLFFYCNDETWPEYDAKTDWYDFLHLNFYGAVPFSRRLSQELMKLDLKATQSDSALWQERLLTIQEVADG